MNTSVPKVFFIHVPKTGGTSFVKMLRSQECLNSIFPAIDLMKKIGGHYPDLISAKKHLQSSNHLEYDLVLGHYPYSLSNLLPGFDTVTILREPRSRFFSHLLHIKTHSSKFNKVPNEQIVREVIMLNNTQVRFFCDNHFNSNEGFEMKKLDDEHLENAIQNLEKCSIVGTTSTLAQTAKRVITKYGFSDQHLPFANAGSYQEDLSVDEEIVHKAIRLDESLYKAAINIVESKREQ